MQPSRPVTDRFRLTEHAQIRMQQRGITRAALELLMRYGRVHHDGHGARLLYFDEPGLERLALESGPRALRQLDRQRLAYAVLTADNQVATVGHRYRRLRRR